MRLFIGVALTGETAQEAARVMGLMRGSDVECRWVSINNLHCTVRFLGEVDDSKLPEVLNWFRARLTGFTPGGLQLAGTGLFQNREQTILWLGLEAPWLDEAAKRLSGEVAGLRAEERPFAAHVTLGRLRMGRGLKGAGLLEQFRQMEVLRVQQTATRIVLYRSRLGAGGATYEELGCWPD